MSKWGALENIALLACMTTLIVCTGDWWWVFMLLAGNLPDGKGGAR